MKLTKSKLREIVTEVINESDLPITTKKGKTVTVVHKKSGKELVIVDNPSTRKKYKRMGYLVSEAESINEMGWSSPEAKTQVDNDLMAMSRLLGKASQGVIKIMMGGVKDGKYDAMDLSKGIQSGNVKLTHMGERDFLGSLWSKMREKFRKYSKGKLRR